MKSKFYRAFNGLFHHASKLKDELVVLQLVAANCKPHLLYATEALNLNVTHRRSLGHAWQCAVSHIVNVTGDNVHCIGLSRYIAITHLPIIAVFVEYLRQFLIDLNQIHRHSSVPKKHVSVIFWSFLAQAVLEHGAAATFFVNLCLSRCSESLACLTLA